MRKVTIIVEDHLREEDESIVMRSTIEVKSAHDGIEVFDLLRHNAGGSIWEMAQKVERFVVLKDTCSQEPFVEE